LLHAIDVDAAVTPKQLRDVMRVEGLTYDEIKSHLKVFFC
jgi:SHAQKYF class myb-like DNA-binding protein